jgi:hypothetical protein
MRKKYLIQVFIICFIILIDVYLYHHPNFLHSLMFENILGNKFLEIVLFLFLFIILSVEFVIFCIIVLAIFELLGELLKYIL